MNIVLLGGPGSGKGTQAQMLSQTLHLPQVASGDLFREHLKNETPLGRKAQSYIARGELVPDEVTIAMIRERLEQPDADPGVILDGFPRTVPQARALEQLLAEQGKSLDLVAHLRVSPEVLLARLSGRWTCENCGAVYHLLFNPPKAPGKCDACGGKLYQRTDDTSEVQRRRIEVYLEYTAPLISYYRDRPFYVEIDGEQSIEQVQAELLAAVNRHQEKTRDQG